MAITSKPAIPAASKTISWHPHYRVVRYIPAERGFRYHRCPGRTAFYSEACLW
ncbi:MAG: hypothetical protein R2795_12290 [Saprospiraceae bacterium]